MDNKRSYSDEISKKRKNWQIVSNFIGKITNGGKWGSRDPEIYWWETSWETKLDERELARIWAKI